MASNKSQKDDHDREGAETVYGPEACYQNSMELLEELGFPRGVLPLQNLVECGRVHSTGFVWMKQKAPYEHCFVKTNTRVSYALEVTAYVEKGKMRRMSGVKSKQMFVWVPIVEMSVENENNIYFKTSLGVGRSFPVTAFTSKEQKQQKCLENIKE